MYAADDTGCGPAWHATLFIGNVDTPPWTIDRSRAKYESRPGTSCNPALVLKAHRKMGIKRLSAGGSKKPFARRSQMTPHRFHGSIAIAAFNRADDRVVLLE